MATKIENAKITGVSMGREDHGILTMMLHLSGGGWGVSYGGYAMDAYDDSKHKRIGHALLAQSVLDLLDVFKVRDIQDLKGEPCRVETEGWGGRAIRIGHFLDDRWFSFEVLSASYKAERKQGE